MNGKIGRFLAALGIGLCLGSPAAPADVFGSGANSFSIDFVSIGNAGSAPDTTGQPNPAGAVAYPYRMGTYEISEQMIDKANALGWAGDHERMCAGLISRRRVSIGSRRRSSSTGSTRAAGTCRRTSSSLSRVTRHRMWRQRKDSNSGRRATRGTTRTISIAIAWRCTFCRARMNGTRRRSTISGKWNVLRLCNRQQRAADCRGERHGTWDGRVQPKPFCGPSRRHACWRS